MIKDDEHENLGNRIGKQQATRCLLPLGGDRARWPMANGLCSLCHVNYATSYHHLIPKAVARRQTIKIVMLEQEIEQNLIPTCRPCHMFIHKAFTHRELALEYNTLEKLKAHPLVEQFVQFIENRTVGKRVRGRHLLIEGGLVSVRPPNFHSRFNRILRQMKKEEERQNEREGRPQLNEVDRFFRTHFNSTWNKSRGIL